MARKVGKRLHGDAEGYWNYQRRYAREVLLPLFRRWGWTPEGKRVLEVGCSEGGIVHGLVEAGAEGVGLEIEPARAENARALQLQEFPLVVGDIGGGEPPAGLHGRFDLIVLRDVIEHVQEKDAAFANLERLLADGGRIFFAFPPWRMPFGGHQQTLKGPLRMVPFLHYLPRGLYARLLRRVEPDRPGLVQDLLATYDARISLARFRRLVKRHGMVIERSRLYLLNPAYQLKFGWPALPLPLPRALEFLGEVFATSMYAWVRRA